MYENKQEEQTAVLAAIDTGEYDAQRSMDELEELAKSAGAKVMGRVIQKKDRPDPATLMGSGRVEELAEFVQTARWSWSSLTTSFRLPSRRIWKTPWERL